MKAKQETAGERRTAEITAKVCAHLDKACEHYDDAGKLGINMSKSIMLQTEFAGRMASLKIFPLLEEGVAVKMKILDPFRSEGFVKQALARWPDEPGLHFILSEIYRKTSRDELASSEFDTARDCRAALLARNEETTILEWKPVNWIEMHYGIDLADVMGDLTPYLEYKTGKKIRVTKINPHEGGMLD